MKISSEILPWINENGESDPVFIIYVKKSEDTPDDETIHCAMPLNGIKDKEADIILKHYLIPALSEIIHKLYPIEIKKKDIE